VGVPIVATRPPTWAATDPPGVTSIRIYAAPRRTHLVRSASTPRSKASVDASTAAHLADERAHGVIVPGGPSSFTSAAFGRVARRSISIQVCGTRSAAKPSAE
jgi:hypothetical protein